MLMARRMCRRLRMGGNCQGQHLFQSKTRIIEAVDSCFKRCNQVASTRVSTGFPVAAAHLVGVDEQVAQAALQGHTLVQFSPQLKRILWDTGAFRGCLGGV
jgi:hypothetical protein